MAPITIREKPVSQKPKITKQLFYRLHRYVGLFVAMNFLILSLTGLTLLFKDDVQGKHPSSLQEVIATQDQFADKYHLAVENLKKFYPNDRLLDIYPDETNAHIIEARLGVDGATKVRDARVVDIDFDSGKIIQIDALPAAKFYAWILKLHRELFLGTFGQLYIGIIGIAYLFMLCSGFVLYIIQKKPEMPPVSRIPKMAKLHKKIGIIIFAWGLFAGLSGMLLAFNPIFTKQFQKNQLSHLAEQYQSIQTNKINASVRDVITTAQKHKPESVIWYIVFPGMERGIASHYLVLMHGTGFLTRQISEYLVINAQTAELVDVVKLPILLQSALVATPVHFANYGGIVLKIVWAIFAFFSFVVVMLGIAVFISRRIKHA